MRNLLIGTLVLGASYGFAQTVFIPMDQQINKGFTYNSQSPNGDAIYAAIDGQPISFESEPEGGFTRKHLTIGGGWWYTYVDLNLAGETTPGNGMDITQAGSTIEFDTRFFHDPVTNTEPYADAPVFLRIYTYAPDGNTYVGYRDYGIVYATQAPWSNPGHPAWTHVTVDLNTNFTEGGTFDPTDVSRIRFYGTDWKGTGDDFVDFKNLEITAVPEPATMLGLAAGMAALLARARRRK